MTVSGTCICRRRQAGSYVSFNLEFTPPALCCRPVAEAEAAAESLKPKQASTLQLRTPRRHPPQLRTPRRRQQQPAVRHPLRHSLWRRGGRALGIQDDELVESKATLDGLLLLDNRRRQHCQESIQVSRSLSITLNSYLSRRLGREYLVNAHAHRPSQPSDRVVKG